MTRRPREKRDRLILISLGTAILLAGLYFGLIRSQQASIASLVAERQRVEQNARDTDTSIQNAKSIETELTQKSAQLNISEEDMASGDPYLWMVNNIRQFQ